MEDNFIITIPILLPTLLLLLCNVATFFIFHQFSNKVMFCSDMFVLINTIIGFVVKLYMYDWLAQNIFHFVSLTMSSSSIMVLIHNPSLVDRAVTTYFSTFKCCKYLSFAFPRDCGITNYKDHA